MFAKQKKDFFFERSITYYLCVCVCVCVCVHMYMYMYIGTSTAQDPTYAGDRRQEIVFIGIDMDQVCHSRSLLPL